MYKILVVDDEPLVRIAIKSLVNWEAEGFDLQLEASQGKEALEIINREQDIDMIITDMNMPLMDGIQLIEALREDNQDIPIVVLSGYNDYNLLRQAFKLGVKDYILKSTMTPEGLLTLLQNTMKQSRKRKEPKLAKDSYIKALLANEVSPEELGRRQDLKIGIEQENFVVCQILIDGYHQVTKKYTEQSLVAFMNTVFNFIREGIKNRGEVVSIAPDEYVVILGFNQKSQVEIRGEINELLNGIRYLLKSYMNIGVTIGVSQVGKALEELGDLYGQAKQRAQLRFLAGKGKNIFPEEVVQQNVVQAPIYEMRERSILEALKNNEKDKVLELIKGVFAHMHSLKINHIRQSYPYYMQLAFETAKCIEELELDREAIQFNELKIYEKITSFETLEEISTYMYEIMMKIVDAFYSKQKDKYSKTITRAIQFIRKHYKEKDLNLKRVSEAVELSEGYFSTLFAKEVQMSFKDFITYVRIERAKQLVEENQLKIYEICDEVGYANVEHFSRVFKKVTGHSPNHFSRANTQE